jgi:glutathione synthase/RimK-type ligase-like ATP-grasp enzyme
MARILIPTFLGDIHATIVAAALRAKGHVPVLWHGTDFPTRQSAAVHFSQEGVRWRIEGPDLDFSSNDPFDVVWYRRPTIAPVLPEDIHPGDRAISRRECLAFTFGLWELVAPDAFWVNPRQSLQRANAKLAQLDQALAVGLNVPLTLCTNDPEEIRRFLQQNEREVIYKAFNPAQWTDGDRIGMVFTSEVELDDLPDDDILRLTPGIFQRRIPKAYELRLTYMGDFLVAAKLLSQESEVSKLDWRVAFAKLRIEPTAVPSELDRRCRELLRRLGILFGCLDLIVTPEGEYVFMEVNQMGQFLWLEQMNPEIRILEPFCEFLVQKRANFCWNASAGDLLFADFYDEAVRRQEEVDTVLHIARPMEMEHSVLEAVPKGKAPHGSTATVAPVPSRSTSGGAELAS